MKKTQQPNFRRAPELVSVPLNDLHIDESRTHDAQFLQLYKGWLTGRLRCALTRVAIESIVTGAVIRKDAGTFDLIEHPQDRTFAKIIEAQIRAGFRPPVVLYPGHLPDLRGKFVCADDVAVFYAYKNLGITKLPSMILGNPKVLCESAITVRRGDSGGFIDAKFAPFSTDSVLTLLGVDIQKIELLQGLPILRKIIGETMEAIRAFHSQPDGRSPIHYHHTLYSVLYRLHEGLLATELIARHGLVLQARPIVRSLYELFLNFYLDWLAPETMGPILQILSSIYRISDKQEKGKLLESAREKFSSLVEICFKVSEKGRLSPLGEAGHNWIYGSLSPDVHQDFDVTEQYGFAFDSTGTVKMAKEEEMFLLRTLDVIVSATVARTAGDCPGIR